jgi:hypothetical protein
MHMSSSIMNWKFDLHNPYISIEEESISMPDERDDVVDNEPIEEVDNVQIGDVVSRE